MHKSREKCLYLLLLLLFSLGLSACTEDSIVGAGLQWSDLVVYPERGALLTGDFELTLGTDAVHFMIVSIDGTTLGKVTEPPFSWPLSAPDYELGEHTLGVTALVKARLWQVSARVLMCHGVGTSVYNFAPMFYLDDLDGVTHSPVPSPGTRAILLDFWATWCGPCVSALPETQRLFEEYGDQGLKVLTITSESRGTVEAFMLGNGYTFPVLLDPGSGVSTRYGATSIPMYFVIDRNGIIRYVRLGGYGTPLEDVIRPLL